MSNIINKMNNILTAKNNIKNVLISKGKNPTNDISTYANMIEDISSGGG